MKKLTHFTYRQLKFSPVPSSKLALHTFSINQAGNVIQHKDLNQSIDNVSEQVNNALKVMTFSSDIEALKELITICAHYDSKSRINWSGTLQLVRKRLENLNYKPAYIDELVTKLSANLSKIPSESVSK